MHRVVERPLKSFLLLALAAVFLFSLSLPALAHASLVEADPPVGEITETRPTRLVLRFNEPLNPAASTFTLIDDQGRTIQEGEPEVSAADPNTLKLILDDPLRAGTYTVQWTTLSQADGHTLRGSYTFSVEKETRPAVEAGTGGGADAGLWTVAARGARWVGLILWIGAALFMALVLPGMRLKAGEAHPPWREGFYMRALGLFRVGLLTNWLGVVADVLSQGIVAAGGDLATLMAPALWQPILLGSRAGWANSIEILLIPLTLLLVRPSLLSYSVVWRLFALTGALVLGGRAMSGHAAAVSTLAWTAQLVDWLHLLGAAFWAGGAAVVAFVVLPVWWAHHRSIGLATGLEWLKAFSPGAIMSFVVLVLTGIASTEIEVGSLKGLIVTTYGNALSLKIALVMVMAVAAGLHTFVLRPRLARRMEAESTGRDDPRGMRWTNVLINGEALLGILVLLSVGALATMTPPIKDPGAELPIEIPEFAPQPVTYREATAATDRIAEVTFFPGSGRRFGADIFLQHGFSGDALVRASDVALVFDDGSGTTFTVEAQARGDGRFHAEFKLPAEGLWNLIMRFEEGSETKEVAFEATLPVPDARTILEEAVMAMNRLDSGTMEQSLSDGQNAVRSSWTFVAPDRMRGEWNDRVQIAIGRKRYMQLENGSWQVKEWPGGPFRWPRYNFWLAGPEEVQILGEDEYNGRPVWIIGFVDGPTDARIRLSVDKRDYFVYKERMVVEGHIMTNTYGGFNQPYEIEPPADVEAAG